MHVPETEQTEVGRRAGDHLPALAAATAKHPLAPPPAGVTEMLTVSEFDSPIDHGCSRLLAGGLALRALHRDVLLGGAKVRSRASKEFEFAEPSWASIGSCGFSHLSTSFFAIIVKSQALLAR